MAGVTTAHAVLGHLVAAARTERAARRALGVPARACEVCGWAPPSFSRAASVLHVHHVVPRSRGGSDNPWNLVTICPNHHAIAHVLLYAGSVDGAPYLPRSAAHLIAALRALESDTTP